MKSSPFFCSLLGLCLLIYGCNQPAAEMQGGDAETIKHTQMGEKTFVYVLKLLPDYTVEENWTEEVNATVTEHFMRLKRMKDKGQVVLAGRTAYDVDNTDNFGVVIFHAEDMEAAREIMENDPAVSKQIMSAELRPFALSLLVGE